MNELIHKHKINLQTLNFRKWPHNLHMESFPEGQVIHESEIKRFYEFFFIFIRYRSIKQSLNTQSFNVPTRQFIQHPVF